MNLKFEIQKLLENKAARYITDVFLKTNASAVLTELLDKTSFLPSNVAISKRLYCVINDIDKTSFCPNCGVPVEGFYKTFDMPKERYLYTFCSVSCSRKYALVEYQNEIDPRLEIVSKDVVISKILKDESLSHTDINSIKIYLDDISAFNRQTMSRKEICHVVAHDLTENPICRCGHKVNFDDNDNSYNQYCSSKCAANSSKTMELRKSTCMEKYGVDNVFKSEKIKDKIKDTNLINHGVENPMWNEKIKEKLKDTMIMRHGVDCVFNMEEVRKKCVASLKMRSFNRMLRFKDIVKPLFTFDEFRGGGFDNLYPWRCVKCDGEFQYWLCCQYPPQCPRCSKPRRSIKDTCLIG